MRSTLKSKAALALLCAWCFALLAVRIRYAESGIYGFLAWNLFLAIVPATAATLFRSVEARSGRRALLSLLFVIWLAFLPNAPYLVTDLLHLKHVPPVPLWYDVLLFGSFAATGILLGYVSVADIETTITRRSGRVAGTLIAYGSLALSGFGIYLGRFLRWNSWDIVTAPMTLLPEVIDRFADPASHPQTWAVTLLYGGALMLGYLVLRATATSLAPSGKVD